MAGAQTVCPADTDKTRKPDEMARFNRRGLVLGASAALFVSGCGGRNREQPKTKLNITVFADTSVNPNEEGTPSPVVVRVYELKGVGAFNQVDYFDLLDDDASALGADLIAKQEIELKPGDQTELDRPTTREAEYLGVVAGFRDISSAQWRTTYELKSRRRNRVTILVSGLSVSVEGGRRRRFGLI